MKLGGTFSCHIDVNEVVLVVFRLLVSVAKYNEKWCEVKYFRNIIKWVREKERYESNECFLKIWASCFEILLAFEVL